MVKTIEDIKYFIIPELYDYLKNAESRIKALEDAQPESNEPAENTEQTEPSEP